MKSIDEIMKRTAAGISKANMPTSSNTKPGTRNYSGFGDSRCTICGGLGYVSLDVPIDDPEFGKLIVCSCSVDKVNANISRQIYQESNIDSFKHMTFETFNPKGRIGLGDDQLNSLTYAFNQAQHLAQNLKGWLLLMGEYGCGKTHLAAAISNYAVAHNTPTLFLTIPDLLDWLRFSFDNPDTSYEKRIEEIRNIDLLVLDDFGTQNATPWAQEKIFQIIDYRYINRLPTVVTTNLDLIEIDGRISSRLQDPDLVTSVRITAPDYRSPVKDPNQAHLSSLHLHARNTFGNFSLREGEKMKPEEYSSLEKAFRSARDFAHSPEGWIVFMGSYGSGKTHLAAAIGNFRLGAGETPMFVVVPDLLDHLRATFSPHSSISYDHLFEEVRTAPMLILDDLGTQSATPWAKEKLYQIMNFRYNAELPTVITTSLKLEEIDPRLRSRMTDTRICKIYAILVPSFRGIPASPAVKTRGQRKSVQE